MKKEMELLPPMMPIFISIKRPPTTRQDADLSNGFKISISELTPEEAEEYGELMKQTFIKHYFSKKLNLSKKQNK